MRKPFTTQDLANEAERRRASGLEQPQHNLDRDAFKKICDMATEAIMGKKQSMVEGEEAPSTLESTPIATSETLKEKKSIDKFKKIPSRQIDRSGCIGSSNEEERNSSLPVLPSKVEADAPLALQDKPDLTSSNRNEATTERPATKFGNVSWGRTPSKNWDKTLIGIVDEEKKEDLPTLQASPNSVDEISKKKNPIERITRKRGTRETYRQDLLKKAQQEEAEGYIKVYSSFLDRFLQANLSNASARIILAAYAELKNKGTDSLEISYRNLRDKTGLDFENIKKAIASIPPVLLKTKQAESKSISTVFFKYDGPLDHFFRVPRKVIPILTRLTSSAELSVSLFVFSYYNQGFVPETALVITLSRTKPCDLVLKMRISSRQLTRLFSNPAFSLIDCIEVGRGQYELALKKSEDINPNTEDINPNTEDMKPNKKSEDINPNTEDINPNIEDMKPNKKSEDINPNTEDMKRFSEDINPNRPPLGDQSSQESDSPNVDAPKNDQNFEAPKNELESSRISYKKRERDAFQNFCNLPENIGRVGNQWPALFEYATRELEARGLAVELSVDVLAETLAHGKEGAKLKSERPIFSPLSYWPSEKGAGFNFFLNRVLEKNKKAQEQEATQAKAHSETTSAEVLKDALKELFADDFSLCKFAHSAEIWPRDREWLGYIDFFEVIAKRTVRLAEQSDNVPTHFLQSKLEAFKAKGGLQL